MRIAIATFLFAVLMVGCGVSSNQNGWSAGMGVCTNSWSVGSCNNK